MAGLLVVDDDPLIAGMLRLVLETEGYEVREAADGEAALDAMATDPPDCMVLDLMMPRVNGYGVLEAMRERGLDGQTRVVMLTCCSQEEDVERCFRLGADEYLTKPVDVDYLLDTVRDLMAQTMGDLRTRRDRATDPAELRQRVNGALCRHKEFLAG